MADTETKDNICFLLTNYAETESSQGLKYCPTSIIIPDTDIADTIWYAHEDVDIANMTKAKYIL